MAEGLATADLTSRDFSEYFNQILLSIFPRCGIIFILIVEQYNDPERKSIRRHNKGPSLVHNDIVSTAPLSQERCSFFP